MVLCGLMRRKTNQYFIETLVVESIETEKLDCSPNDDSLLFWCCWMFTINKPYSLPSQSDSCSSILEQNLKMYNMNKEMVSIPHNKLFLCCYALLVQTHMKWHIFYKLHCTFFLHLPEIYQKPLVRDTLKMLVPNDVSYREVPTVLLRACFRLLFPVLHVFLNYDNTPTKSHPNLCSYKIEIS